MDKFRLLEHEINYIRINAYTDSHLYSDYFLIDCDDFDDLFDLLDACLNDTLKFDISNLLDCHVVERINDTVFKIKFGMVRGRGIDLFENLCVLTNLDENKNPAKTMVRTKTNHAVFYNNSEGCLEQLSNWMSIQECNRFMQNDFEKGKRIVVKKISGELL